jgi:DNA helicase II / ATP-dependent DNA helicase PcrA
VRSMEEFENLQGFLEHVSLVMENSSGEHGERVSIMTLHAAKGLEFETVFLPGWEEGLFPHQRSLDEQGRAGLEEERRLAYVGITRAKRRAKLYFATNRRMHGLWNATIPSRFIDELPPAHVEVLEGQGTSYGGATRQGGFGQGYGASRFDSIPAFGGSSYNTPGWQRAQASQAGGFRASQSPREPGKGERPVFDDTRSGFGGGGFSGGAAAGARGGARTIEGRVLASSTATASRFAVGARVFHIKFGPGDVAAVDGNKLTVDFDKAGRKMVLESFVQAGVG